MRALLAVAILALAACDSTTPELVVPGIYDLQTFNGAAVAGDGARMEWTDASGATNVYWITGGKIVLSKGGGYHDEITIRGNPAYTSPLTITHTGTWTESGGGSARTISFARNGFGETCAGTLTHAGLACVTSRGEGVYVRH